MIAKVKARAFRCSFCGKSRAEVAGIVAGAPHAPGLPKQMTRKSSFICNECVRRFNQLLARGEGPGVPPRSLNKGI